ncbi:MULTISPECIES: penicillin-binding protein 2 [Cyanophyceae]|mgnify:CR=1 FL=1|nr:MULTISPECIES: penicillin-binding protein 2 [Cyanophyceae]ACA99598.1 penicillin-binding protein 2 [Picosynechococcus sp. PCC 7002]SMH29269.1 penicillin-binding protein 2 [Picosynechococcus sp. OG1]SMQ83684.1 penicillin-binding protein 2 [Synechococcus sp. 7002]
MTLISPLAKASRKESGRTVGRGVRPWGIMFAVSLALLGGIGSRLAFLQLVKGDELRQTARNNSVRIAPKPPIRGNMFDRHGKVLATTKLAHAVYVWPVARTRPDWPKTKQLLSQLVGIAPAEIEKRLESQDIYATEPLAIARNLTLAQVTAIEEHHQTLAGVEVIIEPVRYYPEGDTASHVLGYTRELTPEEFETRQAEGYRLQDYIGKLGLEASLESRLRGEWGGQEIQVDRDGRFVKILGEKPAQAGEDLRLTLDAELQKVAQRVLGRRKGAIVALDPRNGDVLAMASYPNFDPNIFSDRISPEKWAAVTAQGDPFINRAIRGFPPASTFKVVTAAAGMESGKYPANTVLSTSPYLAAAGVRFYEWNRAGFGAAGYVKAMAWSSNTFFGQVGRGVGGETLIDWSRRFGFGSPTGIELNEETSGLIPDDDWTQERLERPWNVGDTVNMSIGQGLTLATPLQVAQMFAVTANGGYLVQPHLVQTDTPVKTSLKMAPSTLETIRQGLRAVVTNGTGTVLNIPGIPTAAGKSGTAEAPPRENHAWFGAFAPYDEAEIVVVAFAEHSGGGGGSVAGPMVRDVMAAYFELKEKAENPEATTATPE